MIWTSVYVGVGGILTLRHKAEEWCTFLNHFYRHFKTNYMPKAVKLQLEKFRALHPPKNVNLLYVGLVNLKPTLSNSGEGREGRGREMLRAYWNHHNSCEFESAVGWRIRNLLSDCGSVGQVRGTQFLQTKPGNERPHKVWGSVFVSRCKLDESVASNSPTAPYRAHLLYTRTSDCPYDYRRKLGTTTQYIDVATVPLLYLRIYCTYTSRL